MFLLKDECLCVYITNENIHKNFIFLSNYEKNNLFGLKLLFKSIFLREESSRK